MISYHKTVGGADAVYSGNFNVAPVNDAESVAKYMSQYVWSPCIWRDGRRKQDAFMFADWCVLDFDSPEMTLAQATKSFCDMLHVIGTTRNHQKEKGGVTCDRFRVALKFSHRITDLKTYRHSLSQVIKRYPADPAPKDGARFFYPCLSIVSVGDEGYTEDPLPPPPDDDDLQAKRDRFARVRYQQSGRMPGWLAAFLEQGRLCRVGRNQTVYAAAVELRKLGHNEQEAIQLIARSPIDRSGLSDRELITTVRSGYRRIN